MRFTRKSFLIPSALLVMLLVIVIYLTSVIYLNVYIGLSVSSDESNRYVVSYVDERGWAAGHNISKGDIVLQVNGDSPVHYLQVLRFGNVEQADTLTIGHMNPSQQSHIETYTIGHVHPVNHIVFHLLIPLGLLVLFVGLSVYLYIKQREDKAAWLLILFFVTIGVCYLSAFASGRSDAVGKMILSTFMPLSSVLYIHFMHVYLRQFHVQFVKKGILAIYYLFVLIVALIEIGYHVFRIGTYEDVYEWNVAFSLILFISAIVFSIVNLIILFVKHRHTTLNSFLKYSLTGHLVAFLPFILLNAVPRIVGFSLAPSILTTLFLFVIPIVYFYLITSKQLFDIDFAFNRFKYYTVISLAPSILLLVLLILILEREEYRWVQWVQMFLVIYLGMTAFLYVKEQIDLRFRGKWLKGVHNYQVSLDQFSKQITKVMKHADLEQVLVSEIATMLPVKNMAYVKLDEDGKVEYDSSQAEWLTDAVVDEFIGKMRNQFKVGHIFHAPRGLFLVIGFHRSRYRILWIDDKENRTHYNPDELRWLKTIVNYSTIVYENLHLIKGLIEDLEMEMRKEHKASPWILRLLFNLSENERRRLASDLHDAALQDQLMWYRKLESVITDHDMPHDLKKQLEVVRTGLLDVIHQIRDTCNELRPPLLQEMGIEKSLELLFEKEQLRSNLKINFHYTPFTQHLNDEQILAIYRMTQELIRNASKHAHASNIWIEMKQTDAICFRYRDDGIGMDIHALHDTFEHMGISGIKERVASLEGDIQFKSQPGEGLEVDIVIPFETCDISV